MWCHLYNKPIHSVCKNILFYFILLALSQGQGHHNSVSTVGPYCLFHPVNIPRGRSTRRKPTAERWLCSFHMRTKFGGSNSEPWRWKASGLTTKPPKLLYLEGIKKKYIFNQCLSILIQNHSGSITFYRNFLSFYYLFFKRNLKTWVFEVVW